MSIPNVTDCRYLGITISVKNCDLDLKRQKRRFYANTNMLLRKFVKCSPDVKCCFFKYCCNLYCAPFWYDSTKTAMKNLKVAYNNSLRRLLGLPSHNSASSMFVNLNIPSFGELLRKYVYNFRNRLETSDNDIIRGIYLSHNLLHFSLADGIGGVTSCHHSQSIVLCILLYFIYFLNILIYIISIICKLLYGLCFRNKHIIQLLQLFLLF